MKKIIKYILFLILTVVLISCGKEEKTSSGKAEVSLGIWDVSQEKFLKEVLEDFKKQNPNIDVKIQLTPFKEYWTKLEASASEKVAPDVVWMNLLNIKKYSNFEILEDLTSYIKKDNFKLDGYNETLTKAYTINDKVYGIPKDIDSTAVFYNKEIFDKAGLPYPTNDWKWEDMVKIAKIIKEKVPGVYPLNIPLDDQEGYYNLILQSGGSILDAEGKSGYYQSENLEAIKLYKKLIDEGLLPDAKTLASMKGMNMFQSGKVAIIYGGAWYVKPVSENEIVKGKFGVVEMPEISQKATVSHGVAYSMTKESKNKEAAWKLIKFLTSEEVSEKVAKNGDVIPALESAQHLWNEYYTAFDASPFVKALKNSQPLPGTYNSSKWISLQTEEIIKILENEVKPEKGMKIIEAKMNEAIASEKR
ncbi:MAG: extracellular solute-binding protein [Fusobacteriaceae bacterium]